MNQQNYHCSIVTTTSAADAYHCINQVGDWWTANLEGDSQKQNQSFTVTFGKTFVTFKVKEMVTGKKIVWQVTDCYLDWLKDKKEWLNTSVSFDISSKNGNTTIEMHHIGLVPGIECYDNCVKGWDFYIKQSLHKLISTGKGQPETPKNLR